VLIEPARVNVDEDDSMYVNWWDNPTNPDSWHKHQVGSAASLFEAACQDNQLQLLHLLGDALTPYVYILEQHTLSAGKTQSTELRGFHTEAAAQRAVHAIWLHVSDHVGNLRLQKHSSPIGCAV
jgi:hypothetical protein